MMHNNNSVIIRGTRARLHHTLMLHLADRITRHHSHNIFYSNLFHQFPEVLVTSGKFTINLKLIHFAVPTKTQT